MATLYLLLAHPNEQPGVHKNTDVTVSSRTTLHSEGISYNWILTHPEILPRPAFIWDNPPSHPHPFRIQER